MRDLEARYGPLGRRRCPTGEAVATTAGSLPARWIIHAVGPRWQGGGRGEADLLASAYRTSLRLADSLGARSVTLPAISAGIFGYPLDEAARIAVATVASTIRETAIEQLTFVLFSRATFGAFATALDRAGRGSDRSG
jgi:O-acetyl-ADP-ribose deacetylase (regulator of RNase III)